jgi:hypothetical protein
VQAVIRRGGEKAAVLSARRPVHGLALRTIEAALPRRFDPEQARDLDATLELRVRNPSGGSTPLSLRIQRGELHVQPGPAREAGAAAELGADDMIRLVSGSVGWPHLISTGRMLLTGDPFLALRFPALFRLPVG